MAIQHSVIDDPDIHEPKGASTATAGQVYVADGSGSGTWSTLTKTYTVSLTPAEVVANTTTEETFALSGIEATEQILQVIKPTAQAGLGIVGFRIPSANNLAITFSNNTAAGITPTAAETYTVITLV